MVRKEEVKEVPAEESPETPKADEVLEVTYSKDQAEAIRDEALKDQYNKLNSSLSSLGAENKRLREQLLQPSDTPSSRKITSGVLDTLDNLVSSSYADDPAAKSKIAALRNEAARLEQQEIREVQIRKQGTITQGEREKIDQKIRSAGLDPNDEVFDTVNDAFEYARDVNGNFDKAHLRLDRILNKQKPKKEAPEVKEQDVDESARKMLEEKGLLKTDTGGPSASAMSAQKAMQEYGAGNITAEEAKKRGAKFS